MLRAHRPILRRVHTAVHTTIGSVSVLLWPCALYVVAGLGDFSLLEFEKVNLGRLRILMPWERFSKLYSANAGVMKVLLYISALQDRIFR